MRRKGAVVSEILWVGRLRYVYGWYKHEIARLDMCGLFGLGSIAAVICTFGMFAQYSLDFLVAPCVLISHLCKEMQVRVVGVVSVRHSLCSMCEYSWEGV